MNNIKKVIIVISLCILIFFILASVLNNTVAITNDGGFLVTGTVMDSEKKPVQNAIINFKKTDGSGVFNLKTNSKGEYYGNIEEGRYIIEYTDSNYNVTSMKLNQYKEAEYNLELAFVYPTEFDEKIKLFNQTINHFYDFRRIEKMYTNDLEQKIFNLQRNTKSDTAFHNEPYCEGNSSVIVIVTDLGEEVIKEYLEYYQFSDYYLTGIIPTSSSVKDMIKVIYGPNILNISKTKDNEEIIITPNTSISEEVEINGATIIDVSVKEKLDTIPPNGGSPVGTGDFITGTIYKDTTINNQVSDVTVTLRNSSNNIQTCTTDGSGKYGFDYPGPGEYKLEFDFSSNLTDGINVQYYESSTYDSINTANDDYSSDNCLKKLTNSEAQIKEFKDGIDYEDESKLDTYATQSNLTGESNVFTIRNPEDTDGDGVLEYNPKNHPITADVRLTERPKFSLTVEKNVSRYKIVLNNGQIFRQYSFDQNVQEHKHYRDLRLFNISMDTNLSYGAKLYVEYEIKVKNNSNIDCKEYMLLSTFENLDFDDKQYLLGNTKKKNQDEGWNDKTDNLSEVNTFIDNDYTADSNIMTYLILTSKDTIESNKEKTHYVTLSRPLDAENDDTIFNGTTELVSYKNNEGRRNYSNINETGDPMEYVIKAGNYTSGINEADTYKSEQIAILPPTGFDVMTLCFLVVSTIVCLISLKYIVANKLYINIKRTKLKRKWNKY